ncbi:MAG: porin family protein [Bacteroidales bacterium]
MKLTSFNMKIAKFLVLSILLGTSTTMLAQITGGGRVGVNFANLRGSSVQNNSMMIGYNIGGFVNYGLEDLLSGDISEIMSIQAELSVQTKGATLDFPNTDGTLEPPVKSVDQVFTYVQIPLLAKFTFKNKNDMKFFGEGGIFMGSLFGLTIDGEKSWDNDGDKGTDSRKYREEYSGFDFGVTIGGGAAIPFGGRKSPWEAFANVRFSPGLINIGQAKEKTDETLIPYLKDVKTTTISLLVGVAYKF